MSPTGLPAALATSASVSANGTPSSAASSAPTDDLPAVGGPMSTIGRFAAVDLRGRVGHEITRLFR